MEVVGEDVIGYARQRLTTEELTHLVRLADGDTPSQIEATTGAGTLQQRQLESSIRAKLGARTKPHMISRAFVLDVLAPRALCLLLSMLSLGITTGDGPTQRPPRNNRPPISSTRTVRMHPFNGGPNPLGGLPLELVIT